MVRFNFNDLITLDDLKAFLGQFSGWFLDFITAAYWQWFEETQII